MIIIMIDPLKVQSGLWTYSLHILMYSIYCQTCGIKHLRWAYRNIVISMKVVTM